MSLEMSLKPPGARPSRSSGEATCDAHSISGCLDFLLSTFKGLESRANEYISTPIDLELEDIEERASKIVKHVRYIRNASRPIMRLPREVFATIFELLHGTRPGRYDHEDVPSRRWMKVAHVCRHWRDIALSFPSLWSDIVVDNPRQTEPPNCFHFFRQNAGQCLLRVNLGSFHDEHPHIKDVLQYLSSFRELVYRHFGSIPLDVQDILIRSPAPSLEAFTLSTLTSSTFPESATQLRELFGGISPNLKYVRVDDRVILATNFRNLRQLHLCRQTYSTARQLDLLVDTLNASPLMEDLTLTFIRIKSAVEHSASQRLAHLLQLKRLFLLAIEPGDISKILSHLHLSANVALTCEHEGLDEYESFAELIPHDCSHLDNLRGLTKFRLSLHNAECAVVAASDTSAFLVRDFNIIRDDIQRLSLEFVEVSEHAVELWVDGADPNRTEGRCRYLNILDGTPDVQKVFLNLQDSNSLLGWLKALGGRYSPNYFPCPQLRELHICVPDNTNVSASLVKFLKTRKEGGYPLEALFIYLPLTESLGRDTARLSVLKDVFDKWHASAATHLRPLVGKVDFIRTEQFPRMELPAICTTPTTGRWSWPVWTEELWTTPVRY